MIFFRKIVFTKPIGIREVLSYRNYLDTPALDAKDSNRLDRDGFTTMKNVKKIFRTVQMAALLLAVNFSPAPTAHAEGFLGQISFTEAERQIHLFSVQTFMQSANECMLADLRHHQEFYRQWGVSPFFGDRSRFGVMNDDQRRQELIRRGLPPELLDQMSPTSCIGIALKCLKKGFNDAGQSAVWDRIAAYTRLNGEDGTALQNGLQGLGWKILYWNPITRVNELLDRREKEKDPDNHLHMWGYHAYRTYTVKNFGMYLYNKVDDGTTLVDFEDRVPTSFLRVPFYIGTAHGGYHVFPGHYGWVIEGHSMRSIDDPNTIEDSEFNPNKIGGGPHGQYFSGIIAVPPGQGF